MRKRFLSLLSLVTVLLILLTMPFTALAASKKEATEYTQFICKDLITGEETYQYYQTTPPPELRGKTLVTEGKKGTHIETESNLVTPLTIIGTDERTEVPSYTIEPYSCIAYLETLWPNGEVTNGTAWLFKVDSVCTAAHNLYRHDLEEQYGGFATAIVVWPGRRLNNQPYGSAYMIGYGIPATYINGVPDTLDTINNDYALIKLNSSIGSQAGTLTYAYDAGIVGGTITISGYPRDYIKQYKATDVIKSINQYRLFYEIDTEYGQSGSPIYGGIFNYVYGIHTRGTGGYQYNSGVRITFDMYSFMNRF